MTVVATVCFLAGQGGNSFGTSVKWNDEMEKPVIEPEPEKPRELVGCLHGGDTVGVEFNIPAHKYCPTRRYHDVDACDRLKRTVTISEPEFQKLYESFRLWQEGGTGAALQFYFGLDNLDFNISRGR